MCVIFIALKQSSKFPFIIAANRDEYYERPTAPAAYWSDLPEIIAGRDERAGGTWLGVTESGRFAAITNHYDPTGGHDPKLKSRGDIVSSYLVTGNSLDEFSVDLDHNRNSYNGFGFVFGNFARLRYQNNRNDTVTDITEGVHGLSNHFLNTPWPRVEAGKRKLSHLLSSEDHVNAEQLFEILRDKNAANEYSSSLDLSNFSRRNKPSELPIFIQLGDYGTRSSSVLLVDSEGTVTFEERTFHPSTSEVESKRRFEFRITAM